MYNAYGDEPVAVYFDPMTRIVAPPQKAVADNGYSAAVDSERAVGVVSVG